MLTVRKAPFKLRFPKGNLPLWLKRYRDDADRKQLQMGERARRRGYYTRREFIEICAWETRRRVHKYYEDNSETSVRRQTQLALGERDEVRRMKALTSLRGVGLPMASMLLHLAYPELYPVIGKRALWSLNCTCTHISVKLWLSFMSSCRELAASSGMSLRDLDRALYEYSRANQSRKTGSGPNR